MDAQAQLNKWLKTTLEFIFKDLVLFKHFWFARVLDVLENSNRHSKLSMSIQEQPERFDQINQSLNVITYLSMIFTSNSFWSSEST